MTDVLLRRPPRAWLPDDERGRDSDDSERVASKRAPPTCSTSSVAAFFVVC